MPLPCWGVRTSYALAFLFFLTVPAWVAAQKNISCPDGEHLEIDVRQIAIQYDASSFAGTLSSLSALGIQFEAVPRKLQEAAVATQQWDEFLKGLAAGYNGCAITRQQYNEGLTRIYPRLKEDAASLEKIRKIVSEGQKADEKRFQILVESYYNNLRSFAKISGKEIVLERIEALSEQDSREHDNILEKQRADTAKISAQQKIGTDAILTKLSEIEHKRAQAPPPTPAEVGKEISEIRKSLLANADEAEAAYNSGYDLLDRYRFQEAIPYLHQAVAAVPLPDFYLALGFAYFGLSDLNQAEKTLKEGLALVAGRGDEKREGPLTRGLGVVFLAKGDMDSALRYVQQALKIDERVYGADNFLVGTECSNIGLILYQKGDLDEALMYTKRAMKIQEAFYGENDPTVAIDANNIGAILRAKGDVDGALSYAMRALKIDERAYGEDHPAVARDANNIGQDFQAKGDFGEALSYTQRALKIDEGAYGDDHPSVARDANNIGQILKAKGDPNGALVYAHKALSINEKVFGVDQPAVATVASNLGSILVAIGDLEGALSYTQRALRITEKNAPHDDASIAVYSNHIALILQARGDLAGALAYSQRALKADEQVYGPHHPAVALDDNNVGQILMKQGDLDEAFDYTQHALKIVEDAHQSDTGEAALYAHNIGQILKRKGDLDGAFKYTQRALNILENIYGPNNPLTKATAFDLEQIKKARPNQPLRSLGGWPP